MGTYIYNNIDRIIKSTTFSTDRVQYVFARYERKSYKHLLELLSELGEQYFSEIILDKDELTLVYPYRLWQTEIETRIPHIAVEDPVAIITCDVVEPTVTGYLLAIVEVLSPANVGVYVQGAYTTDHILVDYKDIDRALTILASLKASGPKSDFSS